MSSRCGWWAGEITERPIARGVGIHGSFPYGDTNHQCDKDGQNCHNPFRCPANSTSVTLGDLVSNGPLANDSAPRFVAQIDGGVLLWNSRRVFIRTRTGRPISSAGRRATTSSSSAAVSA